MRPPRPLLAALLATTAVVTAVLCWFAWILVNQERAIDDQRAREQTEGSAEAMAAGIRSTLAEAGDWLSAWLSSPATSTPAIEGAVVLTIGPDGVRTFPPGGLPFVPVVPIMEAERSLTELFVAAEAAEFRERQLAVAAERYRALTTHPDVRVRAGGLFRLGRVLRKSGEFREAFAGTTSSVVCETSVSDIFRRSWRVSSAGALPCSHWGTARARNSSTPSCSSASDAGRWPTSAAMR